MSRIVIAIAAGAFLAGASTGSLTTWKVMSGNEAKAEVRELKASDKAGRAERQRLQTVATQHETARAAIERDKQETSDAFASYLESRPDLRDIDLGDRWVCLVAQADGQPCRAAAGSPDGAVPTAASSSPRPGQDAAGNAADPRSVPPVRTAAVRPGAGSQPAKH